MPDGDLTVVLLADDYELHEAIKSSFFQRAGFVAYNLGAGEDAFAAVSRLRPVLVILSLDLKGTPGDAVCRQIKDDPTLCSTPVALIAHYEDEDERKRCQASGCDEILRRPLSSKQLLAASYRMLKVVVDRFEFRGVVQVDGRCGVDRRTLRECSILNLSSGGAFIDTGKLRPVGSEVLLEFALPGNDKAVQCHGRVAWLNHPEWSRKPHLPAGFGVQFEKIPPQVRADIEDFIHSDR